MPPAIVLGRITRVAASPKFAPAPRQSNVLGISTKLAAKNTSERTIDEFAPKGPSLGNHCITLSSIYSTRLRLGCNCCVPIVDCLLGHTAPQSNAFRYAPVFRIVIACVGYLKALDRSLDRR